MSDMQENRVVFINGGRDQWYEQVIFILRSPAAAKTKNLVVEAERIINEYMVSGKASAQRIERYKKNIMERAAAASAGRRDIKTFSGGSDAPPSPAPPATPPRAKKTACRKYDFTSLLINICLVLCSILLGYIMHTVMSP